MSPIKVEWETEDGKPKVTNFRRMLLTKCQQEFEKDKKDDETLDKMREEITNAESVSDGETLGQWVLGVWCEKMWVWPPFLPS